MRLLYAIIAVLLATAVMLAAPPKAPPVMPERAPPVESGIITWHEVTWPDTTGRQCKWLVCSIPNTPWEFVGYAAEEVAARPFQQYPTTPRTAVQSAGVRSTPSRATGAAAGIITLAPRATRGGTSCST